MGKIKNFFQSFFGVFKKKQQKRITEAQNISPRYRRYLEEVDIMDPAYDSIKEAIEHCQESLFLSERRIALSGKLQDYYVREQDLELFATLEKTDVNKLQNYIDSFKKATKERKLLKSQVDSYDRSMEYLSRYEEEVDQVIAEMEYQERRQADLKTDMAYISGEKEELIYTKEQMEQGLDFLYKFSIIFIVALAVAVFSMGLFKIAFEKDVFIPLVLLAVFTIAVGSAVYIFQRKFRYELQYNALLQARAVELLNRAKALYVNCTGFLNYEYKKYKVRNSEMLKSNWAEYIYQKQLARRHVAVSNKTKELSDSIEKIFVKKGIHDTNTLLDGLLNLLTLDDLRLLTKEVKEQKNRLEREMESLNIKQEKLWGQLMQLQKMDITEEHIISYVIQAYEEDAEKVMLGQPLEQEVQEAEEQNSEQVQVS